MSAEFFPAISDRSALSAAIRIASWTDPGMPPPKTVTENRRKTRSNYRPLLYPSAEYEIREGTNRAFLLAEACLSDRTSSYAFGLITIRRTVPAGYPPSDV